MSEQLVVGAGRLYFNRFPAGVIPAAATVGEGRRYFGNTPDFSHAYSEQKLDHYDSDDNVKSKDASVKLSVDRTGKFTTDSIAIDNLADYLQGLSGSVVQVADTDLTFELEAKQDRYYQIGAGADLPTGYRDISNVVVKKGVSWATTVAASGNYTVDLESGVIHILDGAPAIADGTDIQITFDIANSTREQVVASDTSLYGELVFVADNRHGTNRDILYPYVRLYPEGDYQLKGDDWQKMSFSFEVLKKPGHEKMYIDGRPA